jgi:hypothetical protein
MIDIPLDVVAQIFGWLGVGRDLTNVALVQQLWCHLVQTELFGTVILKCPLRV